MRKSSTAVIILTLLCGIHTATVSAGETITEDKVEDLPATVSDAIKWATSKLKTHANVDRESLTLIEMKAQFRQEGKPRRWSLSFRDDTDVYDIEIEPDGEYEITRDVDDVEEGYVASDDPALPGGNIIQDAKKRISEGGFEMKDAAIVRFKLRVRKEKTQRTWSVFVPIKGEKNSDAKQVVYENGKFSGIRDARVFSSPIFR